MTNDQPTGDEYVDEEVVHRHFEQKEPAHV